MTLIDKNNEDSNANVTNKNNALFVFFRNILSSKVAQYFLPFTILVIFFLLNRYTSISVDDFNYHFKFTRDFVHPNSHERVVSFVDLVQSQYNHYFVQNGRVVMHTLVQAFLMPDNKLWFDLFNTLVFGLFQLLLYLNVKRRGERFSLIHYLILFFAIWGLLPVPNFCMLWLSGSLNYLWAATLLLLFFLLYHEKIPFRSSSGLVCLSFVVLGFLTAATHEVIGLPILLAFVIHHLVLRNKITKSQWFLIIGFFVGALFVLLAPSNMIRFGRNSSQPFTFLLPLVRLVGLRSVVFSFISTLVLVLVLLLMFIKDRASFSIVLKRNGLILWAIFFSFAFLIFIGHYPVRAFFHLSVLSLMVLIPIFWHYLPLIPLRNLSVGLVVLLVLFYVESFFSIRDLSFNQKEFLKLEKMIYSSNETIFESPKIVPNRFVMTEFQPDKNVNSWMNKNLSNYYGKKEMVFLPTNVYRFVCFGEINSNTDALRCRLGSKNSDQTIWFHHFRNEKMFLTTHDPILLKNTQDSTHYWVKYIVRDKNKIEDKSLVKRFLYLAKRRPFAYVNDETQGMVVFSSQNKSFMLMNSPQQFSMDQVSEIEIINRKTKQVLMKFIPN